MSKNYAKPSGLFLCIVAGAFFLGSLLNRSPSRAELAPRVEIRTPKDLSSAFREVARNSLPAIVSIETRAKVDVAATDESGEAVDPNELLEQFFGRRGFQGGRRQMTPQPQPRQQRQGIGSGFIINSSGMIMTNHHVVEGAEKVVVRLQDGRELTAKKWVSDDKSDVAIVWVETPEPLPAIPLGDSEAIEIGDWVLALGNPFNVGTTVTAGIISAKNRDTQGHINARENFLQTDAAINPGNSGGPLVDLNGQVVGINTAIETRSGGYDGVGFAIPINMARWVSDQLVKNGRVKRTYLGVSLQEMTNDLRGKLGVSVGQGALVNEVMENTPAAAGGLKSGDVVVEFAGRPINGRTDLQTTVEKLDPDKAYPVNVVRDGKRTALSITLQEMPTEFDRSVGKNQPQLKGGRQRQQAAETQSVLGMEVAELTPQMAKQLGINPTRKGVLVTKVDPTSPASGHVLAGDLIEKVDKQSISTVKEFQELTKDQNVDDGLLLQIRREDKSVFIVIKPTT